jgi:hypothetical protein
MNILALVAGTLCVLSANGKLIDCAPTTETLLKLKPAAESRRLVWTSVDGKRMAIAMVPASAPSLDLGKLRDVALRINGDPARAWPVDVRLGFGRDAAVTLPAKSVSKPTTLSLVPARYTVTFQAEHYAVAMRSFDLAANALADLGEVRLHPLPLLTGTVVTTRDGKDMPLSGADVSFSSTKPWIKDPHLATTDEKGAFRAEMPENAAEAIAVSHPGVASKTFVVNRGADSNLGVIRLLPGVRLTVKVARPAALRTKPIAVTLYRRDPRVYDPTLVASRELAPADGEVTFDEVSAGNHIVVLQGDGPLARMSVPVKIEEEKPASVEARIEPYTLKGRLTFGGDPLDGATISVHPSTDVTWRADVTSAADGKFGGTAWQRGVLGASVHDERIGGIFFSDSPELGADPSGWSFDIRKRLITGRVYDAETKEPLKAELSEIAELAEERGPVTLHSSVHTDDSGNFKLLAAKPGRYELRFTRPEYLPKSVVVNIAEEDGSKVADFAVERGTAQALVLRWPDGTPIVSAEVYDGEPRELGTLPPIYHSDVTGTAMIRGKSGEMHTLYVMPAEGSIAVVRLTIGGREAKPVEAVVGRPTGALRITAVDSEGKPSPGGVVLRLNGELIPMVIVWRRYNLRNFDGNGELLLDRLPPGAYEVWIVRNRTLPSEAGARVGISTGEERVRIVVPKP